MHTKNSSTKITNAPAGNPHPIRHSEVVLDHSSRLSCILGYSYIFPFTCFLCPFISLTIPLPNSELQLEVLPMSEDLKIQLMYLDSKDWARILVDFPFYKYFRIFYKVLFKIQDLDIFPLPWLVNIRVHGLIVQIGRVEDSLSSMLHACWGSE
jgi:hypothetical protein